MKKAKMNVAHQNTGAEPQRNLSVISMESKKDESLPDFSYLRTLFENANGLKAWVSLKER